MADSAETASKRAWWVLIVDEDAATRFAYAAALEVPTVGVVTLPDASLALIQLVHHAFNMVVLHGCMPGVSGWEACREIRTTPGLETLPVVITTALGDAHVAYQWAQNVGATVLLHKPVALPALRQMARRFGWPPQADNAAAGQLTAQPDTAIAAPGPRRHE